MDALQRLASIFTTCSTLTKAGAGTQPEDIASEMQLNAFEFRNYRTNLDASQQLVLERIVNQWCAMLVKGKTMMVDGEEDKVYLDKDLLNLEYQGEFYPLKAISRMEMFKDADELTGADAPYGLDLTFEGGTGDVALKFNFDHERHRLNFALTLRILRTRDPTLDPSMNCVVDAHDEEEDPEEVTFNKIVATQHYKIDAGIPVVFSVSDLKLYHKLQSSSRHTYLEFFVRYPRQERFLYAKSPTTHLPQQALETEEAAMRRKKERKEDVDEDEEKKKEELKRKVLGDEVPICAMRFDLKNVKLKVPKIPHQIFGRLMAKDDYFPTAIGTFDFQVLRSHLQNRMKSATEKRRAMKNQRDQPEILRIPMYSTWKVARDGDQDDTYLKVGTLTIRLMGYVHDSLHPQAQARQATREKDDGEGEGEEDDESGSEASGSGSSASS